MVSNEVYQNYIGILKEEMIPAMGCTEPIALAYGAARAREVLGKEPERIVAPLQWKHCKKCSLCDHPKFRRPDRN